MFHSKRKISVKKISIIKIPAVTLSGLSLALLFLTFTCSAGNYKNIISKVVNATAFAGMTVHGDD